MGSAKLEEASSIELNTGDTPHYPDAGFAATITFLDKSSPLHIDFKDDTSLNITILHSISQHHPWKNHLPSEYCCNSWIISMDKKEPITSVDAIDILNYLRKNGANEVALQLHKRNSCNRALLNECR